MNQCNTLNAKLSNSQLNWLEPGFKNGSEVTLNLSLKIIDNPNDETNFPCNLLLTNTQVSGLRKVFGNNSSANIKLSKTYLHKLGHQEDFCVDF